MVTSAAAVMVSLHCLTPRPISFEACVGLWRCSHCTETEDNTDFHWVLCTCSRYLSRFRSVSGSMNEQSVWSLQILMTVTQVERM